MKHISALEKIREQAIDTIIKGGSRVLLKVGEDSDDYLDALSELPYIVFVGKYGHYYQYAIKSYEVSGESVDFNCIESGDVGDEYTFSLSDADVESLCFIADMV